MGIIKILWDLQHLHRMAIGEFWDFLNDAMNWQKRFGTGLLAFNETTRLRIAKVNYNDFKILVHSAIHRSGLNINTFLSPHFYLYVSAYYCHQWNETVASRSVAMDIFAGQISKLQ